MVFEKITIFEPHLEGARFGPTFGEPEKRERADAEEHVEEHEDDSGGRSKILMFVLASVAISLVATVLARRYLGGDDYEVEQVELDESMGESVGESVDESIEEPVE